MAWIEKKTTGYAVVWDTAELNPKTGGPVRDREFIGKANVSNPRQVADAFKALMTKHDDRRPDGYEKGCGALLRLDDDRNLYVAGVVRGPETTGGKTWADILTEYLATREEAATKDTRDRVAERWRIHFHEASVTLPDGTVYGPLGEKDPRELTSLVASLHAKQVFGSTFPKCKGRCNPPCTCQRMPYGVGTLRDIYLATIKPVVQLAVKLEYIPRDPYLMVVAPTKSKASKKLDLSKVPLGSELLATVRTAYEVTSHMPDPFLAGDIAALAAHTGMRWSELAALRPMDFDAEQMIVTVNQVVRTHKGQRPVCEPDAKSDNSTARQIAINDDVLRVLQTRALGKHREALLFTAPNVGGPMRQPGFLRHYWAKVQAAMERTTDKRVTVHGMRHGHITALLRGGLDVGTVAARAGHDPSITERVYDHVITADQRRAAVIIGEVLTPATA